MKHIFKITIDTHGIDPVYVKNVLFQHISKITTKPEIEWVGSIEDPKFYKTGDIFIRTVVDQNQQKEFILAQINKNTMCLINLATGNRWSDAVLVHESTKITEDELKQIIVPVHYNSFTLKETIKNKEPIETSNWPHPQ